MFQPTESPFFNIDYFEADIITHFPIFENFLDISSFQIIPALIGARLDFRQDFEIYHIHR